MFAFVVCLLLLYILHFGHSSAQQPQHLSFYPCGGIRRWAQRQWQGQLRTWYYRQPCQCVRLWDMDRWTSRSFILDRSSRSYSDGLRLRCCWRRKQVWSDCRQYSTHSPLQELLQYGIRLPIIPARPTHTSSAPLDSSGSERMIWASTPMHSGKVILITHGSPTTSQAILLLKSGPCFTLVCHMSLWPTSARSTLLPSQRSIYAVATRAASPPGATSSSRPILPSNLRWPSSASTTTCSALWSILLRTVRLRVWLSPSSTIVMETQVIRMRNGMIVWCRDMRVSTIRWAPSIRRLMCSSSLLRIWPVRSRTILGCRRFGFRLWESPVIDSRVKVCI